MKLSDFISLSSNELDPLLEGMSGPEFYNQLTGPDFKPKDTFTVRVPFRVKDKKVDVQLPISLDMKNIEKEIEQYLQAPPDLKKKFDAYAYWYDNFSKLVFGNMSENDGCLFLAACAYCSVNTGLDQNILEAAKLYTAVKHDFSQPNGKEWLRSLASHVSDNISNEMLSFIKKYTEAGSAYADTLTPKLDYKGGMSAMGHRKGQADIFSEVTVSNAKIPNFNRYVKYYLDNNGNVTKDQLFTDLKSGKMEIGGTKVNSFFLNLVFPTYKWNDKIDPATIDRWMIRVFFEEPIQKMVEEDVADWIQHVTDQQGVKSGKSDTPDDVQNKKRKSLEANKHKIVEAAIMQLFGEDVVRQNLVKILHDQASRIGMNSYQLQALAWVNIRDRYGEQHARFAKFEDVMDYAQEAAEGILTLDPNLNPVMKTIKILSSGPRFKFTHKQDVIDTLQNAGGYQKVYSMPPKSDAEAKANKKAAMNDASWQKMKVALKDDTTADVYDLSKSKTPVYQVKGTDRRNTLSKSLHWILAYNPEKSANN